MTVSIEPAAETAISPWENIRDRIDSISLIVDSFGAHLTGFVTCLAGAVSDVLSKMKDPSLVVTREQVAALIDQRLTTAPTLEAVTALVDERLAKLRAELLETFQRS